MFFVCFSLFHCLLLLLLYYSLFESLLHTCHLIIYVIKIYLLSNDFYDSYAALIANYNNK